MPFSERTGDMFADKSLDALAHGVNIRGVMGGIAGTFAAKYPDMRDHYQELCSQNGLKPGHILPWKEEGKPIVYNLATQVDPGADARYDLIDKSVKRMLSHAETYGVQNIGIPQIGCGIGGLGWRQVRKIIKKHADNSPVNVVAYTYAPPPQRQASNVWYNQ